MRWDRIAKLLLKYKDLLGSFRNAYSISARFYF
jgi:hypothetical protein